MEGVAARLSCGGSSFLYILRRRGERMEAYTGFARVYDLFMEDIPYQEWKDAILGILTEHGIRDGLVLELGCGTGKMTEHLAEAGYDMIGVDMSEEMLEVAMERREQSGHDILYLCQDMREFELYGTVRAIVSVCDSINYILEEEELLGVFRLVKNYLDYGGLFLFDINTVYKYQEVLGELTIAENREEGSFIWENYYDEKSGINEYDLTLFIQEESGYYRKYEERHYQRGYEVEAVKKMIEDAGLEVLGVYDGYTKEKVKEDSQRVWVVCRRGVS